jgi:acyl-CoA synthetase (AMP-forming)/AMP-acid ligase II/thioesterase domain-containing protein/acyl carrier protein
MEPPVSSYSIQPQGWRCLQDVLKDRAQLYPQPHLIFYLPGDTDNPKRISYSNLYVQARDMSLSVRSIPGFTEGQPILVYLENQWNTILLFWAVSLAGGLPVILPSFSNIESHRQKHIEGLSSLFQSPICITGKEMRHLFGSSNDRHGFRVHIIEDLNESTANRGKWLEMNYSRLELNAPAFLMMTSGSTGNAKAVPLSHHQVLVAIAGKASVRHLPSGHAFLNWIGLDHVASLVEIHLQALWLGVDQVHVYTADIVSSPTTFLDLLSRHRVCRSFAPNFFLAKLMFSLQSALESDTNAWDLSAMTILASGGEANEVKLCDTLSSLLSRYGAPSNIITPGFGMTETCAGAIFNVDCPTYDLAQNSTTTCVGRCMPGIEMRVAATDRAYELACVNEIGHLEVRGPVVFKGYYRNEQATTEAFTRDGWFRTGDQASIAENGMLRLNGRIKDVININGVKREMADVQIALEESLAGYVQRIICFPSKAPNTGMERVTIGYVPRQWPISPQDAAEINNISMQTCVISTSSQPVVFLLQPKAVLLLPVSTLGKISRAKMQLLFETGVFDKELETHIQMVDSFQPVANSSEYSPNTAEQALIGDISETINVSPNEIPLDTVFYRMGFTSMDLIRLKNRISTRMNMEVPIILLMKNLTVQALATALEACKPQASSVATSAEYDPVVTLNSEGDKVPLWLIHPGVGEILVFVSLTQYFVADGRPVYALRARGFEGDQAPFTSIAEAVRTYLTAIKQRQAQGPYAIAGYSYGTMLAFEICKELEAAGEMIGFCGSFNLPPNIKQRMQQLNWNMCFLHLAQFLALITEEFADEMGESIHYRLLSRNEALLYVLCASDSSRLQELGISEKGLTRWSDVAYALQSMATDYEPGGAIGVLDVFHAVPLKMAARSSQEWVQDHLSKWKDYCRSTPRFHHVGGAHYTMLSPEHVEGFSRELIASLKDRGL